MPPWAVYTLQPFRLLTRTSYTLHIASPSNAANILRVLGLTDIWNPADGSFLRLAGALRVASTTPPLPLPIYYYIGILCIPTPNEIYASAMPIFVDLSRKIPEGCLDGDVVGGAGGSGPTIDRRITSHINVDRGKTISYSPNTGRNIMFDGSN
ncbi:hypothetical protein K438DRAFT_1778196 [Mycena galopus ATCC 62051]|nr:hypothetical protein K438DRAFT_1778196 [Mycena galopus ATCC 62051]